MKKLSLPLKEKDILSLKSGERVFLNGVVYTARDQAHKRLLGCLRRGGRLPVKLNGSAIYYCGPAPALPGRPIGSCGPTTAGRMDDFTPPLLKAGVKLMIGKGRRCAAVRAAIKKYKCIYFLAVGGTGALLAQRVKRASVSAYKDLGPEAIYKLEIENFPLIVAVDAKGNDIFSKGRADDTQR